MNIPDIVLHKSASDQLDQFIASPSHALLLSGSTGSGKTHIAQALALELLGASSASLENQAYYRVIAPVKGSIAIEQVRELTNYFRLKVPGHSKVQRVAVIQDADRMGGEAQNALLKLLEEPPTGSLLILTSSRPQSLLPTIRSRTQLLQLANPSRQALQKHFETAGHTTPAVASALLRGNTNIAEVSRLLAASSDTPDAIIDLVKRALAGTSYDRMLLVDGLAKQKEQANEFVDTLTIVAMASLDSAASKGAAASLDRWKSVLSAANTAQNALERNGNTKLVLTELMLAL